MALRNAFENLAVESKQNSQITETQNVRDRLPASLRASRLDSADTYTAGEVLADQTPNGVATFTFANEMDLIWVRCDGGDGRADPFGGTPSDSAGIICEDGVPNPLTIAATTIKVYAGSGVSINVWGYRYA